MDRDERQPVIVGVGECVDRPDDLSLAKDPAALMVAALKAAERDAGVPLIHVLSRLDIINELSWPYPDPCELLRDRLGGRMFDVRYHPVGGQTPMLALHEAALAIQNGDCETAAVCGGEAEDSVRRARRQGVELPWPPAIPNFKPIRGGDFQALVARALELDSPVHVYPLYENATRAEWRQTLSAGQQESAEIWANNAAVARSRDAAWIKRPIDADQILDADSGNRLIAWPYRKLMVANPIVNQGAAVILTSLGVARRLGVDENKLIFVHGGAAADEARDILLRESYVRSPAMEAVLRDAVRLAPDGFEAVELYSCFPCVPKMARRVLGLDPHEALTVTGGLTFFGAPLNNYMTHATVAMVETLRSRGGTGLLYGQGEYVTKHHAIVLGKSPADAQLSLDYRHDTGVVAPAIVGDYSGPATIETYTVLYDRDETVRHGVVICRTLRGERLAARVVADDKRSIALLLGDDEIIGRRGHVASAVDGVTTWRLDDHASWDHAEAL